LTEEVAQTGMNYTQIPIQRPILDRLAHIISLYLRSARQIRYRPRRAEDGVAGACGEV
jgi:hypothetical protein